MKSESPIRFVENTQFACVALAGCRQLKLAGVVTPNDRFVVITQMPFEIGSDWRSLLGTFRTRHLERSNLFVFASSPSSTPFAKEGSEDRRVWNVRAFYFGMLMLGAAQHESGMLLSGGVGDGKPSVLHVQELVPVFSRPVGIAPDVTPELLKQAEFISQGLLRIHRHAEYQRLQRGFWTWVGGIRESHLHVRLHQFIRAVDALIASEAGRGRKHFCERASTFASSHNRENVLSQLYNLRSAEEHFNPWHEALTCDDHIEAERVGTLRAHQAERLAGDVYTRVLTRPDLTDLFRDEIRIKRFWGLPSSVRQSLWGLPLDLDKIQAELTWRGNH